MAVSAQGLADAIISKVKSMYATDHKSWPVASVDYLQAIKDYLESNLQVTYAYTGVVPPGVPEAAVLTAEVKYTVLSQGPAVKTYLSALKVPSPQGFILAIHTDLISTVTINTPGYSGPPTVAIYPLVATVNSASLKGASSMEECWRVYAEAIITTVLSMQTAPIPTKSPAGSGVSAFTKVA